MKNKKVIVITTLLTLSAVFLIPDKKEDIMAKSFIKKARATINNVLPNYIHHSPPTKEEIIRSFRSQKMRLLNELPHKRDLQNLETSEIHHSPQLLKKFSKKMAGIKKTVLLHENLSEVQNEALDFYHICSDREEYPLSIRSLCLFNRIKLAKALGKSVDISAYPLKMKKLVIQLRPF